MAVCLPPYTRIAYLCGFVVVQVCQPLRARTRQAFCICFRFTMAVSITDVQLRLHAMSSALRASDPGQVDAVVTEHLNALEDELSGRKLGRRELQAAWQLAFDVPWPTTEHRSTCINLLTMAATGGGQEQDYTSVPFDTVSIIQKVQPTLSHYSLPTAICE